MTGKRGKKIENYVREWEKPQYKLQTNISKARKRVLNDCAGNGHVCKFAQNIYSPALYMQYTYF